MKKLNKWFACIALTLASVSGAHAGLISVNGTEVNALNISTSFEDFYQFDSPNSWSANTGLEVANQIAMFVANVGNEFGIFTIYSGIGGVAGGGDNEVTGSGSVTFWEDAAEADLSFSYAADKTDGFIVSELFGDLWNVDFSFSNVNGIDGITVYSFDTNGDAVIAQQIAGVPATLNVNSIFSSNAVAVSAPGSLILFMMAGLAVVRIRTKR